MSQTDHPQPTDRTKSSHFDQTPVIEVPRSSSLSTLWIGGLGILLVAVFLFAYAGVFEALVHQWLYNTMYSYGFLVPLISLYLIWVRRDLLRPITPSPQYMGGFGILLIGLSLLMAGHVSGVIALEELSLPVTISGLVLLFLGYPFLKILSLPICYLLFMIPVWEVLTDRLHLPFQLLSANLGVWFLQVIGIPAYLQDTYIELPNITLEVAQACSGVNYLIAIVAIGIPMAFLFLRGWIRRSLLLVSAVSIAILSNGFRVGLIGTLSYYGLGGDIHGPYHILQGLFVSLIGFVALFLGVWVLSNDSSRSPVGAASSKSQDHPAFRSWKMSASYIPLSLSVLLLLGLTGSYIHFSQTIPVPLKTDLRYLPLQIGPWTGNDIPFQFDAVGKADGQLSREYRTATGQWIQLYIGYYETQSQGKEMIQYRTAALHRNASEIRVEPRPNDWMKINQAILPSSLFEVTDKSQRLVLFWYDIDGQVMTNRLLAKARTAWDALIHRETNGAVIVVTVGIPHGQETPQSLQDGLSFVKDLFPLLSHYIPD